LEFYLFYRFFKPALTNNDNELRKKTAEEWSKQYNADIKAEDINCLGCKSEVLFGHCNVCEIRKCAIGKSLDNCSKCSSFSCDQLEGILKFVPEARRNLEESKNS
jgi:hypothetical protein